MAKYFITGATGTVGCEVVMALIKKGEKVISASRHPEKSKELFGSDVEHVAFDYEDQSTFNLTQGADGVFVLGPPLNPQLSKLVGPFIDFLDQNGTKNVVYLSANGMDNLKELPFHAEMEAELKNSSLDWNIVRPGFFAQNFGNYERENIEKYNILFSPAGEGKTAFISTRDIGEAVAELLTNDDHSKEIFTLTGQELHSYFDAAEMLSDILGKKIVYPNPDEETYRKTLKENGAPDFVADYMIPVFGLIKKGKVDNVTNAVEKLTGHKPEKLRAVLERDFS